MAEEDDAFEKEFAKMMQDSMGNRGPCRPLFTLKCRGRWATLIRFPDRHFAGFPRVCALSIRTSGSVGVQLARAQHGGTQCAQRRRSARGAGVLVCVRVHRVGVGGRTLADWPPSFSPRCSFMTVALIRFLAGG